MTREQKIQKRKQRALLRKEKRKKKEDTYRQIAFNYGECGASWGRRKANGSIFICEMRYPTCEARGYCNGDC